MNNDREFPPVIFDMTDEAAREPQLKQFRDRLLKAVREKDLEALKDSLWDDVIWNHRLGDRSKFLVALTQDPEWWWEKLEEALALGGKFRHRTEATPGEPARELRLFVSPPFVGASGFPWPGPMEPRRFLALVKKANAPLYVDPNKSNVRCFLTLNEVVSVPYGETQDIEHVITSNNFQGYVASDDLQGIEPDGFRVEIEYRDGRWAVSMASDPGTW